MSASPLVMFAGGGTGGHVYPGIAVANALVERYGVEIRWVGTADRMEAHAVPRAGFAIDFLDVAFLKGRRGLALLKAAARLPGAGVSAISLIRTHRPACVVGLGGFVSGPVCAAAAALGVPVFLMEQNARPGITNRAVARLAKHIFASFEASRQHFPAHKVSVLGNPVRRDLLALRDQPRDAHEGPARVLVFGGSQGATTLNIATAGVVREVLTRGQAIDVRHAAGRGRRGEAAEPYTAARVEAEVTEYIDDMAAAYTWADLVVCRAGATTIAELTAVGLPALYVPFPQASDDHQTANARAVVDAGAGLLVSDSDYRELTPAAALLAEVLAEPGRLAAMRVAAKALGRPEATEAIAEGIAARAGITPQETA